MIAASQVEIADYPDVEERAAALGCNVPTGFAVLPRNFGYAANKEELLHEDTALTVRLLFHERGIEETKIEKEGEKFPSIQDNGFEWVGPTVFIGGAVFTGNPHLISVVLGVVANYLTDMFKGVTGPKKVKFNLVIPIPNSKQCVEIKFDGPVEAIKDVEKVVKEVRRGKRRKS